MTITQITSLSIVDSTIIQAQIKENIKAPGHWPLCGEFTDDRHTGPVTQKVFPFDDVIMGNRNDVWQQAIHEPMLYLSTSFTGRQYSNIFMVREILIKIMHFKLSSAKWRQLFLNCGHFMSTPMCKYRSILWIVRSVLVAGFAPSYLPMLTTAIHGIIYTSMDH